MEIPDKVHAPSNLKIPSKGRDMITNQSNPIQARSPQNRLPYLESRRTLIGGGLALLSSASRVMAQGAHVPPGDPFIVLLKGIYQPVPAGQGPANNLGLTTVNLSDGSYAKTLIYPVYGMPESREQGTAIGTFYVSLATFRCAYDLPGGAMAMQFTGGSFAMIILDGRGGQYDEGTFELTILEATGVYSAFRGGHNHMVDRLHQLVAGPPFAGFPLSGYDEFCFCNVSQYPFP
jgi:hypothetical protein